MKLRIIIPLVLVAASVIIGVAAHRGFRIARPPEEAAPEAPVTIPVTRGSVEKTIVAPGKVIGTGELVLAPRLAGQAAMVSVRPGVAVKAGDLLVQLDAAELEEALATARLDLDRARDDIRSDQARAEIDLRIAEARLNQSEAESAPIAAARAAVTAAEAELDLVKRGPSQSDLVAARAELANAEAAIGLAQSAYDQVRHRSDIGMLPQSAELQQATNAYEAARARFSALERDPEPAAIARAQAGLQEAQAQLEQVQAEQAAISQSVLIAQAEVERAQLALEQLARGIDPSLERRVQRAEADLASATLRAPVDGVVLQVFTRPGETVAAGSTVVVMADPAALEIEATVIEEDLPLVQVGQPVEVFFDAAPDLEAVLGEVTRIVPLRTEDARPLYPVYLTVGQMPSGIAPGMTAESSIILDRRMEVLRLPRVLVGSAPDGSAQVRVWADGQVKARSIQVGLRGDVYVEILDGLREGEAVVGE